MKGCNFCKIKSKSSKLFEEFVPKLEWINQEKTVLSNFGKLLCVEITTIKTNQFKS
jgi:hypothetical protein